MNSVNLTSNGSQLLQIGESLIRGKMGVKPYNLTTLQPYKGRFPKLSKLSILTSKLKNSLLGQLSLPEASKSY